MINIKKVRQILILGAFLLAGGCSPANIKPTEMRIASLDWSVVSRVPITEKAMWEPMNFKTEYYVRNKKFIDSLRIKLKDLEQLNEKIVIDVRISALIPMDDKNYDTLSFGKNRVIMYQRELYEWDASLFEGITTHLSDNQKSLIQEYFIPNADE